MIHMQQNNLFCTEPVSKNSIYCRFSFPEVKFVRQEKILTGREQIP